MTGRERIEAEEKLRLAARDVVREYIHGSPDSLALAMVWLRVLAFSPQEEVTR